MGLLTWRVGIVRMLFSYNERAERQQEPQAPQPAFVQSVPSSSHRGSVPLLFYTKENIQDRTRTPNFKHPVVLVFHGGGFTMGAPTMDARWIGTLLDSDTQPVVIAVDYALAPESPFPSAIQDASSACIWIMEQGAEKYGLDTEKIVLAGFSAGGTLAFTTPMWLDSPDTLAESSPADANSNPELKEAGRQFLQSLRGIVSIYPGLDSRKPRKPPQSTLGRFMTNAWEDAYYRQSPLDSPLVSPAAADDDLLRRALPTRIGLYPVADDDLAEPCESFRTRLEALGKHVTGFVEPQAIHAWDKYPIKAENKAQWQKRQDWFMRLTHDIEDMLKEGRESSKL